MVGNLKPMRQPPTLFKTPPYVVAHPVVTHHKMSLPAPSGTDTPRKTKHFLVLATDGLWDELRYRSRYKLNILYAKFPLSNEEVVSLVAGQLSGLKGIIPKSELPNLVPTTSGSQGVNGKSKRGGVKDGSWAFTDDNLSAHLIRNAFGGGDEMTLRRRLSIPSPYSRRNRDDVTVTVVCWEGGNESQAKITSEKSKAKL